MGDFAKTHFGLIAPSADKMWGAPYLGRHEWNGEELAKSVDWTQQGAVTSVKNQGQCGSCWTFSSTGALEGAFKIAGGGLVSMSEQQLVDCCKLGGCDGCSGGLMDYAFQYLKTHHVCTEASYGYTAQNGNCHDSSCTAAIAAGGVTGYKDVSKDDTKALMSAAAQQPVSIAIEADQSSFQSYSGGVLTKECGSSLDHGVLLVGYGTDGDKDYWKVKNSWGGSWGDRGYIRLQRGKGGAGECGLLSGPPSYPVVSGSPAPGPSPVPPSPSPPAPGNSHYEHLPCRSDEVDVQVQGVAGSTCTPKCSGNTCPTDVPAGTRAKPQCVLQDSSTGDKYCALTCFLGGCPTGASCEHIGLTGICMYPSDALAAKMLTLAPPSLVV